MVTRFNFLETCVDRIETSVERVKPCEYSLFERSLVGKIVGDLFAHYDTDYPLNSKRIQPQTSEARQLVRPRSLPHFASESLPPAAVHKVLVTLDNDRGASGSNPFASASKAANSCAGMM